jgi:trigger factor
MMVSVETSGALERRMRVQVPAEQIESRIDERLKAVGRSAKLEGFRPGKVPAKVIRKRFGKQVRQEVISELMQSSYAEALQREQLTPAGNPSIEPGDIGEGKDLTYTAVFEVFPEVELKNLDKIEVSVPEVEIGEPDVDEMLESLRRQRATWEPVERAAKDGDQVVVDFEGKLDGEVFEGGTGEDVQIQLGAGQMLPDFEKGLKGVKAGDAKTFKVKFPKDYPAEALAGKKAEFSVQVKSVSEEMLPPLDDELAAAFGVEEGGLDKLREEVEKNMRQELGTKIKSDIKDQVLNQLLDLNTLDVPQAMVREEAHSMQHDAMRRMGIESHDQAPPQENFLPGAERRVKLGLLMQEFVKSEALKVDPDRVKAKMEELFAGYDDSEGLMANYLNDQKFLQQIEPMVLEEQAIDLLRERGKQKPRSVAFKEYMNAS